MNWENKFIQELLNNKENLEKFVEILSDTVSWLNRLQVLLLEAAEETKDIAQFIEQSNSLAKSELRKLNEQIDNFIK